MRFRVYDLGFTAEGLGFRVLTLDFDKLPNCREQGCPDGLMMGFGILGLVFRIWGLGRLPNCDEKGCPDSLMMWGRWREGLVQILKSQLTIKFTTG